MKGFAAKQSLESTQFESLAALVTEVIQFIFDGNGKPAEELSPEAYAAAKKFCDGQDEWEKQRRHKEACDEAQGTMHVVVN
jgi:hypothetical protein